jgi:hypothetical protein
MSARIRQAVERRCDVGQRGRLCRRGSGECHEPLAPLGDGVLQLGHALADASAQCRGDVVGFEVDELAGEATFEVGDLRFDLARALSRRGSPFRLGGGVEGVPPVVGALGAEEGGGEEREQRVVEPLLVQVHVGRVADRNVLRALVRGLGGRGPPDGGGVRAWGPGRK